MMKIFSLISFLIFSALIFFFKSNNSSKINEYCDKPIIESNRSLKFGIINAWISCLIFTLSRLPQIILNYQRKSVEDISLYMFVFTILGNLTYLCSIYYSDPIINEQFWTSTLAFYFVQLISDLLMSLSFINFIYIKT